MEVEGSSPLESAKVLIFLLKREKKKNMSYKEFPLIIFLISISFFSRAIAVYFFGDTNLDYEWGIIISNLEKSHIFGFRTVDGVVVPNFFYAAAISFFFIFY